MGLFVHFALTAGGLRRLDRGLAAAAVVGDMTLASEGKPPTTAATDPFHGAHGTRPCVRSSLRDRSRPAPRAARMPADGLHRAKVPVTEPDDDAIRLPGPRAQIDVTAPSSVVHRARHDFRVDTWSLRATSPQAPWPATASSLRLSCRRILPSPADRGGGQLRRAAFRGATPQGHRGGLGAGEIEGDAFTSAVTVGVTGRFGNTRVDSAMIAVDSLAAPPIRSATHGGAGVLALGAEVSPST